MGWIEEREGVGEMEWMTTLAKRFGSEEKGQNMTEYGLILALVAVAVIGIIAKWGPKLAEKLGAVCASIGC